MYTLSADKCLGPDGFNPGFYQNLWNNFGLEFFEAGYSWFEAGFFEAVTLNLDSVCDCKLSLISRN